MFVDGRPRPLADNGRLLVAYNGERWRLGFDLPFMRTRLAKTGVRWPLGGMSYADIMSIVDRRFYARLLPADAEGDPTDVTDLEGVYDALVGGSLGELDPLGDSADAVDAREAGNLDDLVLHNVADVLRTQALVERYVGPGDMKLKSLTAVADRGFDGVP